MVRAALIVQHVLDELEAGDADRVEAQVIGAASVAIRDRGYAQVFEWGNPLRKNRRNGRVALRIDAADLARAVIHIEVGGNEFLLRLHCQWARGSAHELRQLHLIGRSRGGCRPEVNRTIALGTEDAFFFACPQCDADGAARFHVQRLENAHRLHGHHGSSTIVRSACSRNPAIQMASHHHHLLLELGVSAGDFGNRVESVLVLAGNLGVDIDLHTCRRMVLREPEEAAITLDRRHHHRHLHAFVGNVGRTAQRGAIVIENGPSRAGAVLSVAAGLDDRSHFFVGKELGDAVDQPQPIQALLHPRLHFRRQSSGSARACRHGKLSNVFEVLIGIALEERLLYWRNFAHGPEQNHLAFQLAFVLIEILFRLDVDVDHVAGNRPRCRRRPRRGLYDQHRGVWSHHARPGVELLPAHAELAPIFQMRILQADLGERVARPCIGLAQVGRSRQPGTNPIHQRGGELHNMRVVQPLIANPLVHIQVQGFHGRLHFGVGVGCCRRRCLALVGGMKNKRRGQKCDGRKTRSIHWHGVSNAEWGVLSVCWNCRSFEL